MKKTFKSLLLATLGLTLLASNFIAIAQTEPTQKTPISMFERQNCTHCKKEKAFLKQLETERKDIEIILYDISKKENRELWKKFTTLENIPKVTPITLVGNTIIQGYGTDNTTGKRIKELINQSRKKETLKVQEFIKAGGSGGKAEKVTGGTCDDKGLEPCGITQTNNEYLIDIPLLGPIDFQKYSLPTLSLVLGFVDGFNPCAMWVLVTFLVILIDAGSKKRMWQLAGIFVAAEAIMYYLILNVWFTTWDFIGLNNVITPIVGTIAIGAGAYFLYEWKTSDGTCKVTSSKQKSKTREKLQKLVSTELTILSILGILGIAFSVNIIEFACSIGIPQTFTKIIELNNLGFWQTQFYMMLYILMYMADDIIIFGIALYSFEKIGITSKYTKLSHLIGGSLMLILGLILILNPELLVF